MVGGHRDNSKARFRIRHVTFGPLTRFHCAMDDSHKPILKKDLGPAGWFTIVILLGFLAGAIAYAIHAWNAISGVTISPLGWFFMALGVFFTLLVGAGLMALVFYSSRHNYDQ
jgi:hypothetical protein